jgi:phosphoribosylamine--glycine ligase
VVLASEGYPEDPITGLPITGLDRVKGMPDVTVAHAATASTTSASTNPVTIAGHNGTINPGDAEGFIATGGRVLSVVALGDTFADAREKAYSALGQIHLNGSHFRTDIAERVS